MIVTFFNASGIDFGNFLNAHLKSKILSPNYVTSIAMTILKKWGQSTKVQQALFLSNFLIGSIQFSNDTFLWFLDHLHPRF